MPEARLQRCREAYETPWQTAMRTVIAQRELDRKATLRNFDRLFEEWQNRPKEKSRREQVDEFFKEISL